MSTPFLPSNDLASALAGDVTMGNRTSRTAYYTLAVRAWAAALPKPLCADTLAKSLMDEEAERIWQEFKAFHRPNVSNAVRHTLIDEHLTGELTARPDARVVVIGAGFDTRAFRLSGGQWLEVDEAAILDHKEARLPARSAPNPLTRLPIDFSRDSLAAKLAPFASQDLVHVVVEGVLMYLTEGQRRELLAALRGVFPHHFFYCELMTKSFFERYSRDLHEKITTLGASFKDMSDTPEALVTDAGYRPIESASILLRAAQLTDLGIPPFLIRWLLWTLRDGYRVWKLELPL